MASGLRTQIKRGSEVGMQLDFDTHIIIHEDGQWNIEVTTPCSASNYDLLLTEVIKYVLNPG